MDALLVGGGLAAGGYLLNTSKKTKPAKVASFTPDVYDNCGLDSRVFERQTMSTHLGKGNVIENTRYVERPESVRVGTYREENTKSLTGEYRNNNEFTHNNMQPFFGSQVKQNIDENATSGILERFTGVSVTDKPKEEIEPMFSQQSENIYGTQATPETIKSRFEASRYHQGVPINEPVRVGPGLNKGYTATPEGGFQQSDTLDYVRDPTVDEMRVKTNPKVTYEGRVIRGFKGTRRGMTPVVSKNRVIRYHAWDDCPRVNATPVVSAPRNRDNFLDKCTNRQNTLSSYTAPAGPATSKNQQSLTAVQNLTTNRQELNTFGYRNAQNTGQKEAKLNIQYCSEVRKVGAKDNKYVGQASTIVQKMMAPLQDIMRPTIKETNIHDVAPERNMASIQKKATVYDPNDTTRPTIKETNIHNTREGFVTSTGKQIPYYNPNDTTKPTIKETNIHDNQMGQVRQLQAASHPAVPLPTKTTARETLKDYITSANLRGPNRAVSKTVTPAKTTVKETICEDNRKGIAGYSMGQAYTTNPVVAPDTFKQHTTEYSGQAHGNNTYGAYSVTDATAPDTVRQETSDIPYQGIADGMEKPKSYADIYNATLNEIKEDIAKGRTPTQTGCKSVSDRTHLGEVEITEGLENRNNLTGPKPLNNTVMDSSMIHMKNEKCQFDTSDRLDASNLEAFKCNPLTQSLHSSA